MTKTHLSLHSFAGCVYPELARGAPQGHGIIVLPIHPHHPALGAIAATGVLVGARLAQPNLPKNTNQNKRQKKHERKEAWGHTHDVHA